jgi:hypothetical protein
VERLLNRDLDFLIGDRSEDYVEVLTTAVMTDLGNWDGNYVPADFPPLHLPVFDDALVRYQTLEDNFGRSVRAMRQVQTVFQAQAPVMPLTDAQTHLLAEAGSARLTGLQAHVTLVATFARQYQMTYAEFVPRTGFDPAAFGEHLLERMDQEAFGAAGAAGAAGAGIPAGVALDVPATFWNYVMSRPHAALRRNENEVLMREIGARSASLAMDPIRQLPPSLVADIMNTVLNHWWAAPAPARRELAAALREDMERGSEQMNAAALRDDEFARVNGIGSYRGAVEAVINALEAPAQQFAHPSLLAWNAVDVPALREWLAEQPANLDGA